MLLFKIYNISNLLQAKQPHLLSPFACFSKKTSLRLALTQFVFAVLILTIQLFFNTSSFTSVVFQTASAIRIFQFRKFNKTVLAQRFRWGSIVVQIRCVKKIIIPTALRFSVRFSPYFFLSSDVAVESYKFTDVRSSPSSKLQKLSRIKRLGKRKLAKWWGNFVRYELIFRQIDEWNNINC